MSQDSFFSFRVISYDLSLKAGAAIWCANK